MRGREVASMPSASGLQDLAGVLVATPEQDADVADAERRAGHAARDDMGGGPIGELALSQTEVPACWWWQNTAGSRPCTPLGMQTYAEARWSPATAWLSFSRTYQDRFSRPVKPPGSCGLRKPVIGAGMLHPRDALRRRRPRLVDCLGCISIGASRRQGVPARIFHELGNVR
jgi:hypothetical protein